MDKWCSIRQSINFVYSWGEGDRKSEWSGTPWGLFSSLSNFASVADVSLTNESRIIDKINHRLFRANDFNIGFTKMGERQLKKATLSYGPILMFTEFNTPYLDRSYLYQDLTVDYLCRLKKTSPDLMKYTPLSNDISQHIADKRRRLSQIVNENCKGIFTMSKWLADDLINSGISPTKVHHVGGGCTPDVSLINYSQKRGNKFLFVGKTWELKNGPLVVSAFCKLLSDRPDIHLYIVGPAECPKEILDLPDNFKKHVHFIGRLDYADLVEYYNLCDYYVMPSRFDAYGLVFAEALIFGLPCIGKNAFAMPEFIDESNGYLINNNSLDELADCMDKIISNKSLVDNVKNKHDYYIEKYSWDSVAKRMINVFEKDGFNV